MSHVWKDSELVRLTGDGSEPSARYSGVDKDGRWVRAERPGSESAIVLGNMQQQQVRPVPASDLVLG